MNTKQALKIYLLDAFHTGSHKRWSTSYQNYSEHQVELFTLPGRHWKWRMHGAALSFSKILMDREKPDIVLATDMLDLSTLIGLRPFRKNQPAYYLYFHENQLSYPWSKTDPDLGKERNIHYGFINYTSAMAADKVFFNSSFHKKSFLSACINMLQQFPDKRHLENIDLIEKKSQVLYLGMDLDKSVRNIKGEIKDKNKVPVLLWNHRWEYDKDPDLFFKTLIELKKEGLAFNLVVLGASYKKVPEIYEIAKVELQDRIVHWGYASSKEEYDHWVRKCDIIPVTSKQDFFGGSIVESIFSGVLPLLPDRLAYPEHIPLHLRNIFLYEGDREFAPKLKWMLNNLEELNQYRIELKKHVSIYDWKKIVLEYDETMTIDKNQF